jgi:hypothetical protein
MLNHHQEALFVATIGPGFSSPLNLYSTPGVSPFGQSAGCASPLGLSGTGGPQGMGYGRQVLSDIDVLMALMALLEQGATAPTGAAGAGMNPTSLAATGGKGGGATLARAGGKGAQTLARAGGKGVGKPKTLAKAGGK